jgi:hypothetical protein
VWLNCHVHEYYRSVFGICSKLLTLRVVSNLTVCFDKKLHFYSGGGGYEIFFFDFGYRNWVSRLRKGRAA